MRKFLLLLAAAAAAAGGAPAGAAPVPRLHHGAQRDAVVTILKARIASLNARIDMLSDGDAISRAEAQELRRQARRLESRLHALGRRDAGNVELGVERLESRVRFASEDARWRGHVYARGDDDRDRGVDRVSPERRDDFSHLSRSIAPPVDRWHDPFDRGCAC